MANELSDAQKKKIADKKKLYIDAFKAGAVTMDDLAREYHDVALDELLSIHGGAIPPPPPVCPPLPSSGRPQPAKGANADPLTWSVTPMRNDPTKFKVVDAAGINVADLFDSQAHAELYVQHFKCDNTPPPPPPPPCPAGQHRDASGNCVPDLPPPPPPPPGSEGPYQSTGNQIDADIDSKAGTRHYASGKPDDRTIEANAENIQFQNYQFVVDVTMHGVEHDDSVSLKFGGTHNGSGWFDAGVSFEDGECCLGKEEDHPSTDLCVERGPSIGSIVEKPIKIACVYRTATNHQELWTNFEGSGWVKQLEADDLGGFNPNSDEDEAQLRIDGFDQGGSAPGTGNVPTIRAAFVQEIAPA